MPDPFHQSPPVVFTAFANPKGDLANLTREQNGIQDALSGLESASLLAKHLVRTDTDLNAYFNFLREWQNRLVVFHYGGHADSAGISLQNAHTFFEPLAQELVQRNPQSLRLVVLNGCSTQAHVEILLRLGVPAVIATSASIDDNLATEFALRFYRNLAQHDTLQNAYASAANYVKGLSGQPWMQHFGEVQQVRNAGFASTPDAEPKVFPWCLYVGEQSPALDQVLFPKQGSAPAPTAPAEFNKKLTRALVEAMSPLNPKAAQLCRDFSWLEHPDNRRKVQQFVFQHFVGEVGKQLRKLINIGDDTLLSSEHKRQHYVDKCLDIAKRSFDLVNYTLLSTWWDAVKIAPRALEPAQQQTLRDFFEKHLEHNLEQQLHLLGTLCAAFQQHQLAWPFQELPNLLSQLDADSALHRACRGLELAAQAGDVARAEEHLASLLGHFAFLTQYRMASIKKIGYRQMRNGEPEYLHRYVALGIDVKYSEDAEKGRWIALGEQTPAILLYRGDDYRQGINLFPFVIDYNALTFEQGAKICFFSAKDLGDDDTLEYRFLSDNSTLPIRKTGIRVRETNLDELMMNPENLKTLNLDCVVEGFHDARRAILGESTNFFDSL